MKKSLLLLLMLTLHFYAFSQLNGDYYYSIGLKGYSMIQLPKVLNQKSSKDFTEVWGHGLMVKFNDNQFSYRLSGSYLNKKTRLVNNCVNCEAADGKVIDYIFKVGFEKNLTFSRIQPYLGLDIGYRSNRFEGVLINTNPALASARQESAMAAMEPNSVEATKMGFVAAPVIGVKINPLPVLSIYAEGGLDYFISYERQETVTNDASNTVSLRKFNKTEFLLNPLTVGLQIHLGSTR